MPAFERTTPAARTSVPRVASLTVDEDRLAALWPMSADERRVGALRGEFSLGEMLEWASRCPCQVPVVNGEFFFVTAFSEDAADWLREDL
jgi:hypothetical protein